MKTLLKWHGGKSYLAADIAARFPTKLTHYAEPYFGAGSLLFSLPENTPRSAYVNDLNEELMRFWYVLQNYPNHLAMSLKNTPVGKPVFQAALKWLHEANQQLTFSTHLPKHVTHTKFTDKTQAFQVAYANAFFVLNRQSRQGLMKSYITPTARTRRGMNENVSAFISATESLEEFAQRIRKAEIYNQPALSFIYELDAKHMFFYCDPPYLHETRVSVKAYKHEMTEKDHERLLTLLSTIKGKFLISGYPSKLYDKFAKKHKWKKSIILIDNKSSSKKTKEVKQECLWSNY